MTGIHPQARDDLALAMICAWNGVTPEQAPPGFAFHTCDASRIAWDRVAAVAREFIDAERGVVRERRA